MATDVAEYDSFAGEYVRWRDENVCDPIERYTVYNKMLKPLFDEHDQLTGKRVLDIACGHGHYTRELKELNCDFIVGVDLSSALIDIARDIERNNPKGIEYLVSDAANLPTFEQPFDLITAFYLFHFARTRDELIDMVRGIYTRLGENKHFIGLLGNPTRENIIIDDPKYNIKRIPVTDIGPGPIPEGTELIITFYSRKDGKPWCSFSNYYYSPETYEQVFKDVGFKTFQWIHYEHDPSQKNQEYYSALVQNPTSIGIVATK